MVFFVPLTLRKEIERGSQLQMSTRVLPPAVQGVVSVNVAGQISGLHGTPPGQATQWQALAGIIADWRWKMVHITVRSRAGRICVLGWNWLETVGICKGFRKGSRGRADRWFVISGTKRHILKSADDKSHKACGLVTPFAQQNVANVVETLLLPVELCTLNAFSGQRQAGGTAKVCHDSLTIVPRD